MSMNRPYLTEVLFDPRKATTAWSWTRRWMTLFWIEQRTELNSSLRQRFDGVMADQYIRNTAAHTKDVI